MVRLRERDAVDPDLLRWIDSRAQFGHRQAIDFAAPVLNPSLALAPTGNPSCGQHLLQTLPTSRRFKRETDFDVGAPGRGLGHSLGRIVKLAWRGIRDRQRRGANSATRTHRHHAVI